MSAAKVVNTSEGTQYIQKVHKRLIPVYILFKLTGMLPMQIGGPLAARRNDIYYSVIFFVVYFVICAYSMATFPERPTNVSEPRYIVVLWATTIVGCQMLMIFFAFRNRGALVAGLSNLARVDLILRELRIAFNNSYNPRIGLVFFLIISVLVRSLIVLQIVDLNPPQMIATFIATLAKTMCKYQFAMLITTVNMRFRNINACLEELMYLGRGDDVKETARRARLQRLTRAHFKLCNVCRSIHTALSFTLLLSLIQTACDIFQHTFYLYLALTKTCEGCGIPHYLCPVLWLVDEAVETINLIRACEILSAEANRFPPLLHKLRRFVSEACAKDIYSYSIECLHQHVKFDISGFVFLDYNMLYLFLQVFSTYFIISIQFFETHFSERQGNSTQENLS